VEEEEEVVVVVVVVEEEEEEEEDGAERILNFTGRRRTQIHVELYQLLVCFFL
jgi:hypothetical protein